MRRQQKNHPMGVSMQLSCVGSYIMATDGRSEEKFGCVDSKRGFAYFVSDNGVLSERSTMDCSRIIRHIQPPATVCTVATALTCTGSLIFIGYKDGCLATVDPSKFILKQSISKHKDCITAACSSTEFAYTADSKGVIHQWNGKTGTHIRCTVAKSGIRHMAYDDQLKILAAICSDRTLNCWNDSGLLLISRSVPSLISAIGFAHATAGTSHLWCGDTEGKIHIYSLPHGTPIRTIAGHASEILQIREVGTTVWTSGIDNMLGIWDSCSGTSVEKKRTEDGSIVSIILPIQAVIANEVWTATSTCALSQWRCTTAGVQENKEKALHNTIAGLQDELAVKNMIIETNINSNTNPNGSSETPTPPPVDTSGAHYTDKDKEIRQLRYELSNCKELNIHTDKELEHQKRLMKEVVEEHAEQIRVLRETQDRNMALLEGAQEEVEELKKRLSLGGELYTAPTIQQVTHQQPQSSGYDASRESFIVTTRRPLVSRILSFSPLFDNLITLVMTVENGMMKCDSLNSLRESISDQVSSLKQKSINMKASWTKLVHDFFMEREKAEIADKKNPDAISHSIPSSIPRRSQSASVRSSSVGGTPSRRGRSPRISNSLIRGRTPVGAARILPISPPNINRFVRPFK